MTNTVLKYSFLFVFLILLQVLIFNNVLFLGYLNPIIYILFIFSYPIKKNKTILLIVSFFLGLSIDFFSNSGGSNAAATLFIAYFRLPILHMVQNKSDFDYLLFDIKKLPFVQKTIYIISLTFIHHFILFFLEYYKFYKFGEHLSTVLLTSLFTSLLIGFSISLFFKNTKS